MNAAHDNGTFVGYWGYCPRCWRPSVRESVIHDGMELSYGVCHEDRAMWLVETSSTLDIRTSERVRKPTWGSHEELKERLGTYVRVDPLERVA